AETAQWVTSEALQIHGAAGYGRSLPLERMVRDARMFAIGGGTLERMRNLIADRILPTKSDWREGSRGYWTLPRAKRPQRWAGGQEASAPKRSPSRETRRRGSFWASVISYAAVIPRESLESPLRNPPLRARRDDAARFGRRSFLTRR